MDLSIDSSTMRRTLDRFWATGDVKRKDYPVERGEYKLTTMVHLFLLYQLLDHPGIHLRWLKDYFRLNLGLSVTEACIYKFLKKKGFIRQHMRKQFALMYQCLKKICLCFWMRPIVINVIFTVGRGTVLEECR